MASTAWYIGGIVETAIGPAAPWFIVGVMIFAAPVLALYVEGSGMFVRGGVYKVVREAMGGTLAKVSVSALMFDYVLTGAISSVSAGQYLAGLVNSAFPRMNINWSVDPKLFSVSFALVVVAYFWRQNIRGIEESSDKAVKIMSLVGVGGGDGLGRVHVAVRGCSGPLRTEFTTSLSAGWPRGNGTRGSGRWAF